MFSEIDQIDEKDETDQMRQKLENLRTSLFTVFEKERPDLVLVQGDTTTTMAASLASFYCRIPVGHIEAGLRTQNKYAPFPEEINRRLTTHIADLHFAPTERAKQNLMNEGVPEENIHVTGNTVIDALFLALKKIKSEGLEEKIIRDLITLYPDLMDLFTGTPITQHPKPKTHNLNERKLILVTGHRRESFGGGFERICVALKMIGEREDVQIVYPVHLNPNVQGPVKRILGDCPRIHLIKPLDYLPFVYLMSRSHIIITDSGGIQEEAPSLGKPVLVMRETTERPEAVDAGTVMLVGTDSKKIFKEAERLLDNKQHYQEMSSVINPYGDGRATGRILSACSRFMNSKKSHSCHSEQV